MMDTAHGLGWRDCQTRKLSNVVLRPAHRLLAAAALSTTVTAARHTRDQRRSHATATATGSAMCASFFLAGPQRRCLLTSESESLAACSVSPRGSLPL